MEIKRYMEWLMGFVAGLLAPLFGLVMFFEIKPEFKMYDNFDPESFKSLIFQIASIGLILNIGLFFIALRFNKEGVSRGIMQASILFLVVVTAYKFVL